MMMMMMVMMIHNDIKERYDGGIVRHKTKIAVEKVVNMLIMAMMTMMAMIAMMITMTTVAVRSSDKMDDWRS